MSFHGMKTRAAEPRSHSHALKASHSDAVELLIEKKDVAAVRHRMKQRRKREQEALCSSLCVSLTKESDDDDDENAWEEPNVDLSFRDLFRR